MKRKFMAAMLAGVMALSLCAAVTVQAEEAYTTGDYTSDPVERTAGGNPISVATAEKGGDTVTFANNEGWTTPDDFNGFTMANKSFMHLWGDSLQEYDYDEGAYKLALAESIEWDEDYLTCHVKVREGIPFNDGNEMTAEDVAFSYERIAHGDEYGLANTMSWGKLEGAEVTGDYTVDIHFSSPMPNFNCESCFVLILEKAAYEADPEGFWDAPVGTGPYKFIETDFVSNKCTLELWNEDWWGYEAYGKEPGNVKYFKYTAVNEDSTRVSSLRAGEVQICGNLPFSDMQTVLGDGLQVLRNTQSDNVWLCINVEKLPVAQDIRIRQAMSYAIDRQAIVDAIVGNGVVSNWVVPQKTTGYRETDGYEYDPAKAAELMAEAGYDGSPITLQITSGNVPKSEEIGQAVMSYLQAAGFNVTIEQMETAAYNDARFSGQYTVQLCSFAYSNGETWKIMDEIVGRTDFFKTNIVRDEAWAIFDEAMVEMDLEKRDALMQDGYALVFEDYDPLYLYDRVNAIGVADNLEGLVLNTDATFELRFMNLK